MQSLQTRLTAEKAARARSPRGGPGTVDQRGDTVLGGVDDDVVQADVAVHDARRLGLDLASGRIGVSEKGVPTLVANLE